jgi:plastocyanin
MTTRTMSCVRAVVAAAVALVPMFGTGAYGAPRTIEIVIEHFAFVPSSIAVAPGDTVVFTNRDITPHTATAADGSWGTKDIPSGKSETLAVPANAGGTYVCRYHPAMRGRLVIIDAH